MHVRLRLFGKPDSVVVVESKLTKIEIFRRIIQDKFGIEPKLQRLLYGGKLLEDGYTFHDYNIKLNDVIQLMVKVQPVFTTKKVEEIIKTSDNNIINKDEEKEALYIDTDSRLYAVNDLIDVREREQGSWIEGKIVRICYEPNANELHMLNPGNSGNNIDNKKIIQKMEMEDDENKPPISTTNGDSSGAKNKTIAKYFTRVPKGRRKPDKEAICEEKNNEESLLFKVQLDADDEDSNLYCNLKEIRPRARSIIQIKDIKIGQKVMINYNPEEPLEKGFWFDFKVSEIKKLRSNYSLVGTLYFGPDAVPQHDTKVRVQDNIYDIEEVVPFSERTTEYNKRMEVIPDKRSMPLNCLSCRDDEEASCKDCGCFVCLGKESPDKIVLCDECNYGYHMTCLEPPLSELPEEDWYCPSCKRDTNNVIAPGAAKQTKKSSGSKTSRDWGRGMACIGKTKTCAMPANHFGPIPGIEVGMCWRFRIQLSESGVHRPPVSGIHGRDVEGAYSIVLSGGYEDDVDNGNEFTYTGSGGRDLSGNKRTAEQSCDQTLTRENKALARNCAVNRISEEGGDAGDNWREGKPVRVVRSYKMLKHFPKYAPKEGIRYDGIYKVVKYYPEKGLSGYRVWKYLLRRDDPSPAPWETGGAKHYPIIYPDGYLEAEAEKKALKGKGSKDAKGNNKKRALRESNISTESEGEVSRPRKKRKMHWKEDDLQEENKGKQSKIEGIDKKSTGLKLKRKAIETALSVEEEEAINADTVNSKIWSECMSTCKSSGKKEFVEHVTQMFLCIICQDVVVNPVTTPCSHNFCMACIKQAFKLTGSHTCPYCRHNLAGYEPEYNEHLKKALRAILTGYDAGKK